MGDGEREGSSWRKGELPSAATSLVIVSQDERFAIATLSNAAAQTAAKELA